MSCTTVFRGFGLRHRPRPSPLPSSSRSNLARWRAFMRRFSIFLLFSELVDLFFLKRYGLFAFDLALLRDIWMWLIQSFDKFRLPSMSFSFTPGGRTNFCSYFSSTVTGGCVELKHQLQDRRLV